MALVMRDHLGDTERHTGINKYKSVMGFWGSVGFGDYRKGKEACVDLLGGGYGQKRDGGSSRNIKEPTCLAVAAGPNLGVTSIYQLTIY